TNWLAAKGILTVTYTPVQYPFPPSGSIHTNSFPMQPGVLYGQNQPGKYQVGGCPGGTCHTLDGLYPPLPRDLHPIPWLFLGMGGFAGSGTALESAASRAEQLANAMGKTKDFVTIAVTETAEGVRVISSSENALRPSVQALLRGGEVA